MATPVVEVPPFDPYLLTGPTRAMGPIVRTGTVTLDTPFGEAGKPEFARALWVGTSGNISYVRYDGTTQVLNNATAGGWHWCAAKQVNTSGTTALNLVWGS